MRVARWLLIRRRMITRADELKDRVDARRHQLMTKLSELQADTRKDAAAARDRIKRGLGELEDTLRDGWGNVSEAVRTKLNGWLDRT